MTKQEKIDLVNDLVEKFKVHPNFYLAQTGGMSVEKMNELRRACYDADLSITMIKNKLIIKALDQLDNDYSELYTALKQPTSVIFTSEDNPSVPAKVLKEFRKSNDFPTLKAACIDTAVFLGDDQLETLTKIKSKGELIGEVVGLLQSPAKNVISALKSGGNTLAGLVKTLMDREEG